MVMATMTAAVTASVGRAVEMTARRSTGGGSVAVTYMSMTSVSAMSTMSGVSSIGVASMTNVSEAQAK
jgi:hypothetical protein